TVHYNDLTATKVVDSGSNNTTLYLVRRSADASFAPTISVTHAPILGGATRFGEIDTIWTTKVALEAAKNTGPSGSQQVVEDNDTWSLIVAGTSVNGTVQAGIDTLTLAEVATKLTPAINSISGISGASWVPGTGTIDITSESHLPVVIADVTQLRAAAYDHNASGPLTASVDSRTHITGGTYELSTPGTPTSYQPGDVWAVVINGQEITAPGPNDDSPRTLNGLAKLLSARIEAAFDGKYYLGEQAVTATLSGRTGAKVLLGVPASGNTTNSDAFTTGTITRGGGEVEALFDIDHTSPLKGRVRHPLYYYSSFFGNRFRDFYEYTATIQLELYKWDEGSLQWTETPASECDTPAGITGTDPGSSSASDPFIQCNFTVAGEYAVKVNSFIDFADTSTIYGYPNYYYTDRAYGVAQNQSYDLIVSIQRHDVNTKTIDLENTIFTLTNGAAAGQFGQIESYNSDRQEYLIKHLAGTIADNDIGEFAISSTAFNFFLQDDGTSNPPPTVIDTYTARLTAEPTDDVVVDVQPIPTRTFNASEVFNADENFGQNEQTQVTAATNQTLIKLEGVAQLGETWSVTVTPTDIDNDEWVLETPITVSHTVTNTSINAIASALQADLQSETGITANLVVGTNDTILIKLNSSLANKLFFTHFDITSEIETPKGTKTFADSQIQITTTKTYEFTNIDNIDNAGDEITLTILEPNTATSHVINHTIRTSDGLGTVIKKLSLEVGKLYGFESTTSFRYEEDTFNIDTATLQISSDKRFKTTWEINGIGSSGLLPLSVTFAFDGDAVIGEILTLDLDDDASITHTTEYRQHPAEFASYFDAKIAAAKNTSTPAIYNLDVAGRELTISRYDRQPLTSSYIAINTDRFGAADIIPQIVFTSTTWAQTQNVAVMAINDNFIDGNEALAFPNLSGTLSSIRGPLTIQGGVHAGDDRYLDNPVTLPNETNLQLSDGFISKKDSVNEINGDGDTVSIDILTDYSATHINPSVGERPGFDPRMNDYRYSFVFFDNDNCTLAIDPDASQSAITTDAGDIFQPEVASVSENILSINGSNTDFTVSIKKSGSFPAADELLVTGTPVDTAVETLQWREVVLEFDDLPTAGSNTINIKADLNLDGTYVSLTGNHQLAANTEPATLVKDLADAINDSGNSDSVVATVRIGLQGESRLFIRSTFFTDPATGNFKIQIVTDLPVVNQPTVSGTLTATQAASGATLWSDVGFINLQDDITDKKWELTLTRVGAISSDTFTAETTEHLRTASQVTNWFNDSLIAYESTFDYSTHVSGSEVTFNTETLSACVSIGDGYYYAPYNPNLDVDESLQIDRLILDNSSRIGGDTGRITADAITGFGMGQGTVMSGQTIAGGIQLKNIEELDVYLGSGMDTVTVESTIAGITTIHTGQGDDTLEIKDAYGHTNINTGSGNDTVNLGNDQQTISALGGVVTIDFGTGTTDELIVNHQGSDADTTTTLTDHSIQGMGMPRLPEIQTIEVRASTGTYKLHAETVWSSTPTPCAIDPDVHLESSSDGFVSTEFDVQYDHDDTAGTPELRGDDLFTKKIACLLGLANTDGIIVEEDHSLGELNYIVKFTNGLSGQNLGQFTWAEERGDSELVAYQSNTINVRTTTAQNGTTTPAIPRHQTITVPDLDETFALRLSNLTPPTITTQTTSAIAFGGSAQDLFDAMDPILNPNNYIADGSQPYTDNFAVTKQDNVFHLFFRGEHTNFELKPADITTSDRENALQLGTVTGGIFYHNADNLEIEFGQGVDVLNIQGTSTDTNLALNDGDDNIFISSDANATSDTQSLITFLPGNLQQIKGRLAVDAGNGTHRLMISDEAGTVPRIVTITGTAGATGLPTDLDLYLVGLSDEPITIDASATGNFSRGTTIWTGVENDEITVEAIHKRPGVESITSLNTGLGNDHIIASLTEDDDGLLIVNGQGPYIHVINMNDVTDNSVIKLSDLSDGNHRVDPDSIIITVTDVAGADFVLPAEQYQINATLNRIGLFATSLPRNYQSISVQVTRDFITDGLAYASIAIDSGSGDAYVNASTPLTAGDIVAVSIDDGPISIATEDIDLATNRITLPEDTVYTFDARVSVTVTRTVEYAFNSPLPYLDDNDIIDGSLSTDQLVLVGGHGDDVISGGAGQDILIGDHALVYYTNIASPADYFTQWIDAPTSVIASNRFGSGGPNDAISPTESTASATALFVVSIEPDYGGNDTITTGNGRDIAIGGAFDDTLLTSPDT
ncbi:MAG: hypothetical protein ACKVK0_10625, partial [Pirellulales bacterium]